MNSLKQKFQEDLKAKLKAELGLENDFAVPSLKKITINTSARDLGHDKELLQNTREWIATITGQTPRTTKAKKAIAGFNIRENDVVGVSVTLRGERAYDFIQKLINIVLPQTKDFQGIKLRGFDGKGNYSLGLKEQLIFPEVEYDKIKRIQGLEISINTSGTNNKEALALLTLLGMPFEKQEVNG